MNPKTVALAVTGASGAPYTLRLLHCLVKAHARVYLMFSKPAQVVISMETDLKLPGQVAQMTEYLTAQYQAAPGQLTVLGREQWTAPIASGSGAPDAMVVCPCTVGTLAAIAAGLSSSLLERAADVALKERKKLMLVVREAPFSAIHLENMLKLARLGAVIMPASPGFYHRPQSLDDLVDFMVARILDHLDISHHLTLRWGDA